jgi:hypothetical protein
MPVVLAELRRHPVIIRAAKTGNGGHEAALLALAETVHTRACMAGKRAAWVLAAIGEAAADLAAEGPGLAWVVVAKKVRTYCDNAKAPRTDRHTPIPGSGHRRRDGPAISVQETPPPDERLYKPAAGID